MQTNGDQLTAMAAGPVSNPELYAVEPPEPCTQLIPGEKIEHGDLKRVLGQNLWEPVDKREVGTPAPGDDAAYARVTAPEGYLRLDAAAEFKDGDILWRSSEPGWRAVDELFISNRTSVLRLYLEPMERIYACRPTLDRAMTAGLPIPAHHRPLATTEKLRRGDKYTHAGLNHWRLINEEMRGGDVLPTDAEHGEFRAIRPIHPRSQAWYVDMRRRYGRPDALGSQQDPFDSIDNACAMIEQRTPRGDGPYGVIFDVRGTPLTAYDLPEPGPDAFEDLHRQAEAEQAVQAEQAEQPAQPVDPIAARRPTTPVVYEPHSIGWIAKELGTPMTVVAVEATAAIPEGWRRIDAQEEIRPGDSMWMLTHREDQARGVCSFVPCTARMAHEEANDFFVIRRQLRPRAQAGDDQLVIINEKLDRILTHLGLDHDATGRDADSP